MDTILILSGKGGAGKTTIARELGVAGVLAGRKVAHGLVWPQGAGDAVAGGHATWL
jgi:anion-transporting  ArsA/GET3 family ATPase